MHLLLTGANGFVGSAIASAVVNDGYDLRLLVRHKTNKFGSPVVQSLFDLENVHLLSSDVFSNIDCIIHAAARAHIMIDEASDSLAEYRRVNVEGTLNLARQAVAARVKRFIFISSIKVNGEQTINNRAFRADDLPAPVDAYGVSKWEAEQGLMKIAAETGLEVVIIRPSLVYGPGAKGNLAILNKLVAKGIPLPLGSIENQRSLIGLDNLVDLIITCIDHPLAANQVFLASDGKDLSISDLVRSVAEAAGKPLRLIRIPVSLLMLAAVVFRKKAVAQRLLGSLTVDISKTRDLLGWEPPIAVDEGLRRCFIKD
ncbi:SDR family oxidoreductase [Litorivicinus sp.]|nr:SDR family oxidoreductase [Litorivicinus sp.]